MTIDELRTKRIGVLGLGANNLELTKWLLRHRLPEITICDQDPTVRLEHKAWEGRVRWRLGSDYLNHLTDFEIVFRTPGIPYLSPAIQQAKAAGVAISSQTRLFFDLCPAKIIGVTGTKGKGTTSSLIYEILKKNYESRSMNHGKKTKSAHNSRFKIHDSVYLAGNIGEDPFKFLDDLTTKDWVVLELSSFQLQDLEKSPHIAVVLDVTSDHLDHHRNREEYASAKTSIVRYQTADDYAVLNLDSPVARSFAKLTVAQAWYFSASQPVSKGVYIDHGKVILSAKTKRITSLIETQAIPIYGSHHLLNVAAAVTAAYLAGATQTIIRETLKTFRGLPHRLQRIYTIHDREFYNDSAATNPVPTIAAVKSFNRPIHLIVGGSSKGADFSELGRVIAQESTVATVIPLGNQEGSRITQAVAKARHGVFPVIHDPVMTMDEAVDRAVRASQPGDVILLSPAAASFDLFKNYKVRGDEFYKSVQKVIGVADGLG